MTRGPLFVSVLGWSGTGKTTFIVKAIEECRRRGLSAAAAKRARHEPDVASQGKDSTLFLRAGAGSSLYVGDHTLALFQTTPVKQDRDFYLKHCGQADLIFLEGAEVSGGIRVLLAGAATKAEELKRPSSDCDLILTANPRLAAALPETKVLDPGALAEILDYLEACDGARGTRKL